MALTFRTGSGGKGSALTINELDNNFRHLQDLMMYQVHLRLPEA